MTRRLLQLWRACCGAIGFAVFAALALGLALVVLPIDRRLRPRRAELRAQRAIHLCSRFYLGLVEVLGVLRIQVQGRERLPPGPCVVVANHPTLFDVILLCALMPQLDCVVKASWARNVFLRGLTRSAGYVRGDSTRQLLRQCLERLAAGRSLLIFPEGTRSPRGGLGRFERGAAHVALAAGRPLLPVLLGCRPTILSKGQKWYDLGARPVQVTIRVGQAIHPEPFVSSRQLNDELREYFLKGLDLVDVGTRD